MTERSIVEAAARLRREHEPYLVATVVAVRGSAYRRPGARMLLTRFRWVAGSVSGGCLEGDIANKGWWHTRDGEPTVVTYDSRIADGADDEDVRAAFGLGCDGAVEVLLERAGLPGRIDALAVAERCLRAQQRGAIATVIRSDDPELRVGTRAALVAGGELEAEPMPVPARDALASLLVDAIACGVTRTRTHGTVEVLVEAVLPPPRLFVIGTGHDAVPVVALARGLGWDVVVCARATKFSTRERFAQADEILVGTAEEIVSRIDESERALAVVMSHDYARDREHLATLVGSRVRYIGMLGPAARTHRMLGELGLPPDPRIHAPVGLELGGETPQEIALAIMAEAQALVAHASARNLRDRVGPIHAAAPVPEDQALSAAG